MNSTPNTSTGFSWSTALALLDAAADAYQECTICDRRTDAQACIREIDQCLVVAFRGSAAPLDFVQDAKFELTEYLRLHDTCIAKVHAGFLEDIRAVGGPVLEQVKALLSAHDSLRPVYVTGHSLGGALAILCALDFAREMIPIAGVYTFGQPRVGNASFARLYDCRLANRTWRLVNANDLVPRLPGLLLGYRHCGQEILMASGRGCLFNPPWWQIALYDAVGICSAFRCRSDVLISEHCLVSYRTVVGQDAARRI